MTGTDENTDVSNEVDLSTVVDILDNEHARCVLTAVDEQPHSASELSDRCGVSETTVYRHLEQLQETGLIDEQTRPRSDGHHEAVYVATLTELSIRLTDGTLECSVECRQRDVADDLTRLWEGF